MFNLNLENIQPAFLIIGVQKGGTTSLHNYLLQHSKLISPEIKELHFFDTNKNYKLQNYVKQFPKRFLKNKLSFEATPRYLYYPKVAKKIFNYNSEMKFIILIRDPVKRAYSAYNMYKQFQDNVGMLEFFKQVEIENSNEQIYSIFYKDKFPSFQEYVDFELENSNNLIEPSIIKRGYYFDQIKEYLKYFKLQQFLFIDSDNLKINTLQELNRVSRFLNIKNFDNLILDLSLKHKRTYESKLDDEIYNNLLEHYRLKNKGLNKLTSLNFKWLE